MDYEELDASTKLKKKLVKMKDVMAMAYATQYLSSMAMLNAIFNVQAEVGWLTGRACQLFEKMKCKYNPNDKLSWAQMIQKINEIKPKKREDPKLRPGRLSTRIKLKYMTMIQFQHTFSGVCIAVQLELMQAQVETEVNNAGITYESLIRHMNVAQRIKSGEEEMQEGDDKVAL